MLKARNSFIYCFTVKNKFYLQQSFSLTKMDLNIFQKKVPML